MAQFKLFWNRHVFEDGIQDMRSVGVVHGSREPMRRRGFPVRVQFGGDVALGEMRKSQCAAVDFRRRCDDGHGFDIQKHQSREHCAQIHNRQFAVCFRNPYCVVAAMVMPLVLALESRVEVEQQAAMFGDKDGFRRGSCEKTPIPTQPEEHHGEHKSRSSDSSASLIQPVNGTGGDEMRRNSVIVEERRLVLDRWETFRTQKKWTRTVWSPEESRVLCAAGSGRLRAELGPKRESEREGEQRMNADTKRIRGGGVIRADFIRSLRFYYDVLEVQGSQDGR
ncbi:hypothetical protein C8R45DRAFT_936621 [Mycena sanguinolenta]|nr:hypothetical protein C8R45DRAFT_936621 [Mycena sanguinolenta]